MRRWETLYWRLEERVSFIERRLDNLKSLDSKEDIEKLRSSVLSLRGLVNRKLSNPPLSDEVSESIPKETIDDGLNKLRGLDGIPSE